MSTATTKSPVLPKHRRLRTAVVLALVVAAVLFAFYWHRTTAARRELEAAVAETDQLEPGWRLEEMAARHRPVPDDQNAAKQILRVQAVRKNRHDAPQWLRIDRVPNQMQLGGPEAAVLNEYFADEEAARIEALKLAELPYGCFTLAEQVNNDRFENARQVNLWLNYLAALSAQENDGDGAIAACRGSFNAIRTNGVEPWGLGQTWCRQHAPNIVAMIERVLAQTQPSDEALAGLQESLERELALTLGDTLRSRRARDWKWLEQLKNGSAHFNDYGFNPSSPRAWLAHVVGVNTDGDAADYLKGINRLIAKSTPPTDGREGEFDAFTTAWQKRDPFLAALIERATQAKWEHYWSQTVLRRAHLGVAAERYRLKNGYWPVDPADLVKTGILQLVPLDPSDGQPIRWTRQADGVSIDTSRYGSFRLWDPASRRQKAD